MTKATALRGCVARVGLALLVQAAAIVLSSTARAAPETPAPERLLSRLRPSPTTPTRSPS